MDTPQLPPVGNAHTTLAIQVANQPEVANLFKIAASLYRALNRATSTLEYIQGFATATGMWRNEHGGAISADRAAVPAGYFDRAFPPAGYDATGRTMLDACVIGEDIPDTLSPATWTPYTEGELRALLRRASGSAALALRSIHGELANLPGPIPVVTPEPTETTKELAQ